MAAVGANQWKGGFLKYKTRNKQMETFDPANMDPDSYLGTNITQHNTVEKERICSCQSDSLWTKDKWEVVFNLA